MANELSSKKFCDDELDKNTTLCFNQTPQNYLKVSVGNDVYKPIKKYRDRIQITDTTITKSPNTVGCLIQKWLIKCNDKNGGGKVQNFVKSSKINKPTGNSGEKSIRQIGESFMYVETQSKIYSC